MAENNDQQNKISKIRQEITKIFEENDELKKFILKDQNINDFFNNNLKLLNLNSANESKKNVIDSSDNYSVSSSDDDENDHDSAESSNSLSTILTNIKNYYSKLPPELQKSIQNNIESGSLLSNTFLNENQKAKDQNQSNYQQQQQVQQQVQQQMQQQVQQREIQEANNEEPNQSNDVDDESEAPNIEVELFPRTFPRRWNINTFAILHPSTKSQYKPFVIPNFASESENEDLINENKHSDEEQNEDTSEVSNQQPQTNNLKRQYMRIDLDSLHFDGLPPGVHSDIRISAPEVSENSTSNQNQDSNLTPSAKPNYGINDYKTKPNLTDNSTMKEQMSTMLNRLEINKEGNSLLKDSTEFIMYSSNQSNISAPKEKQQPAPQPPEDDFRAKEGPIDPLNDPNYFLPPEEVISLPEFSLNEPEPSSDDAVTEIPQDQLQTQQDSEQSQKKQPQQQQNQVFHSEQMNMIADRFINTLTQKFGQQISNDRYIQLVAQLRLQQQKLQQQTKQPQQQNQQQQVQQQSTQQQQTAQQQQQQSNLQSTQQQQQQQNIQQQTTQQQQSIQSQPNQQQQQQQQSNLQLNQNQPNQQQQQQQSKMQSNQSQPIQTHPVATQPVHLQPIPLSPINQSFIPIAPVPQSFVQLQSIPQQYVQLQPVVQQFVPLQSMPQQFIPAQAVQQQQQTAQIQSVQHPQSVSVPANHFQQPSPPQNRESPSSQNQVVKSAAPTDSTTAQMQRLKQIELEKARQEYFQRVQSQNKQYEKLINVEKFSTEFLNKQTEKLFGDDGKFKENLKNDTESASNLFKKYPSNLGRFLKFVPYHDPKQKKMIELKGVLENGEQSNRIPQSITVGSDDNQLFFQDNDQDN